MATIDTETAGTELALAFEPPGFEQIPGSTILTRLNYYDGKFLRADDLRLEQDYFRRLVELDARAGGSGLVYGFDVTAGSGDTLTIGGGLAFDGTGRVLYMPAAFTVELQKLIAATRNSLEGKQASAGSSSFAICPPDAGDAKPPAPSGAEFYVLTIAHAEDACGEEDVFGKLCDDGCATSTDRAFLVEGVIVRAEAVHAEDAVRQLGEGERVSYPLAARLGLLRRREGRRPLPDQQGGSRLRDLVQRRRRAHRLGGSDRSRRPPDVAHLRGRVGGASRADRDAAAPVLAGPDVHAAVGRVPRPGAAVPVPAPVGARRPRRGCDRDRSLRSAHRGHPKGVDARQPARERSRAGGARFRHGDRRPPDRRDLRRAPPLRNRRSASWRSTNFAATCSSSSRRHRCPPGRSSSTGGLVELPPAGYLPVTPGTTPSVDEQVRRLLGPGVDLRFCVASADYVPRAFESAQHMDRISLVAGLEDAGEEAEGRHHRPRRRARCRTDEAGSWLGYDADGGHGAAVAPRVRRRGHRPRRGPHRADRRRWGRVRIRRSRGGRRRGSRDARCPVRRHHVQAGPVRAGGRRDGGGHRPGRAVRGAAPVRRRGKRELHVRRGGHRIRDVPGPAP